MGTDELLALICVGGPMLATVIWTAAVRLRAWLEAERAEAYKKGYDKARAEDSFCRHIEAVHREIVNFDTLTAEHAIEWGEIAQYGEQAMFAHGVEMVREKLFEAIKGRIEIRVYDDPRTMTKRVRGLLRVERK